MTSAALGLVRVLDDNEWDNSVVVEGYEAKPGEDMNPFYNSVSPGYFKTLGLRLLAGREFLPTDDESTHKVGIVNEKFARRFFGDGGRAIGRHFGMGGGTGAKADIEIVGVIHNAKYMNMREDIREQVFVPYTQATGVFEMTAYVRTRTDPEQVLGSVRRTVREMDPNLPVFGVRTLDMQLDPRFRSSG